MQQKSAERVAKGLIPNANPENWFADGHDLWEVLSAFGFPATAEWAETRRRVVLSATGLAERVRDAPSPPLLPPPSPRVASPRTPLPSPPPNTPLPPVRQCSFVGLLRVMAEVKGLVRICREINVLPGGQPRALSNQELVDVFYRLR